MSEFVVMLQIRRSQCEEDGESMHRGFEEAVMVMVMKDEGEKTVEDGEKIEILFCDFDDSTKYFQILQLFFLDSTSLQFRFILECSCLIHSHKAEEKKGRIYVKKLIVKDLTEWRTPGSSPTPYEETRGKSGNRHYFCDSLLFRAELVAFVLDLFELCSDLVQASLKPPASSTDFKSRSSSLVISLILPNCFDESELEIPGLEEFTCCSSEG
ncbi:unnamed protein product [Vicia faba]|uniref:Uncharacterized protein n=1 Tax=Vicia faba TaxID=3906 RepID=A0AAV1AMV1_VICFA|nr:unnamed protein product [Vicia faba]